MLLNQKLLYRYIVDIFFLMKKNSCKGMKIKHLIIDMKFIVYHHVIRNC